MRRTITSTPLALLAVVLSQISGATAPQSPGFRGKWKPTEDGGFLTLPNGQKFVIRENLPNDGDVRLTFPNGQAFLLEGAKTTCSVPFVSKDGSLVAIERVPSTKSGDLHLYIKDGVRHFREVPNVNEKISKLLEGVKGAFGGDVLRLRALSGRTLTLDGVDYYPPAPANQPRPRFALYRFRVKVARNGSLSLVK